MIKIKSIKWIFTNDIFLKVYVNEVGNDIAAKAVDTAITYVKKNTNLGISISVTSVEGNRTDSKPFLEASKSN